MCSREYVYVSYILAILAFIILLFPKLPYRSDSYFAKDSSNCEIMWVHRVVEDSVQHV